MTAFLFLTGILFGQTEPTLRFERTADKAIQVVARLPAEQAAKLPAGRLTQEQGETILALSLLPKETKTPGPVMIGKYDRSGDKLVFLPRFPLDAGLTYRAHLKLASKPVTLDYQVPQLANQTPPKVVKVYPTTDILPANHLKFYIYFDRPMRGGKELFDQIVLIDDKGKIIEAPWLLDEIWDEENNCLIIYIHPGRIKWGVLLRQLFGPVLFEKREYSLVVRGEMCDPQGNKIGKDYVKKFRTIAEDRVRIDLTAWKLSSPKAGSFEPLTLTLPKSIDHRSLQRFLTLKNDKEQRIAGTAALGKEEKTWQFTPAHPWQDCAHHLDIDGRLEDVAGNRPTEPFDVDLQAPKLPPQKLRLEFNPSR